MTGNPPTSLAAVIEAAAGGSRPGPRVSVCVPTFNGAPFIAETIESILAQDYHSFEVLIADHGSTDRTRDILWQFAADPRVRLIFGPAGGGAEENWNRATEHAVGDYIKLVCADDPLYPACLTKQVAAFEGNPGVVLVASKRDIIDARGAVVVRSRGLAGLAGRVASGVAVRRCVLSGTNIFGEPSSVLMRADAFRAAGPWSGALPYLIDADMYCRVLRHGDLYALPETLATFRLSTQSWSLSLARAQAAQTRAFHELLKTNYSDALARHDLRIGGARAEFNAWARRVTYLLLNSRLDIAS